MCAAGPARSDNPPLSESPAQVGTTSVRTRSDAPNRSANEQASMWKAQAQAMLGPTTSQETLDLVYKEIDMACAPKRLGVLTVDGHDYPCTEVKGGFEIPKNALDGAMKTYKELAEKVLDICCLPEPTYTPRETLYKVEGFVASGAFDSVAGFEDPASWDEFCLLSEELFDDLLWDEALEKAEGREDRLKDVLEIMWGRPEYAEVRALCKAKAARIVGRR